MELISVKSNGWADYVMTTISTFKLPNAFRNVPIIVSIYHLYASFHELLITFPKSQRYSLGASCQNEMLLLLKECLKAASSHTPEQKLAHLSNASASLDTLRLLINLAKDCRCISNQTYQQLDSRVSEIGRMLGGWVKSLTSSP